MVAFVVCVFYGSHLFGHALNIDNQINIQLLSLIKLGLCGLSLVSIIPAMVKLCTWQHRLPLHSSFPSWGSWLVIKKHIKACGRRRKCLRCAVCPHYEPANRSLQLTSLRKHARSRAHLDNVHLALGIPREVLDGAPPAEQFGKVIVLNQILAYYVNVLNMKDVRISVCVMRLCKLDMMVFHITSFDLKFAAKRFGIPNISFKQM
jgi:hypothetical protein